MDPSKIPEGQEGAYEFVSREIGGIIGYNYFVFDEGGSQIQGTVSVNRYLADKAGSTGGIVGDIIYEENEDAVLVTNCYYLNGCVDESDIFGEEDAESGVYGMDMADRR